ncbi:MAG: acyltransferase family protein [Xanthobacteraceae bacterium]
MAQHTDIAAGRVAWVDYAKGFCIVMVVMMHSTLGVGAAAGGEGFMHALVEFAKPFRMPDFFLISGLFLARVIGRDWKTYLDRKVVHFAYFYALWMTIQFVFKAPGIAMEHGAAAALQLYAISFIEPFGTLWFIYLLPVFFVVTKLTRAVPAVAVWLIAAGLEIATVQTGWTVIDEFASRFVYFYTGYILAPHIFVLAAQARRHVPAAIGGLLLWSLVNGFLVFTGYAPLPFVSLTLGLLGALAIVSLSALLEKAHIADALRYCGQHSIVIYLAFFLPMAATRVALVKTGIIPDIGVMSLIVTTAGILGPLVLFWLVRETPLRFLFERPARFWLTPKPRLAMQPAE